MSQLLNLTRSILTHLFIGLVRLYQLILSPYLGGRCRFIPSCSEYAVETLQGQPPFKALILIFIRLGKCHPFGPHGVDLPPQKTRANQDKTKKIKK